MKTMKKVLFAVLIFTLLLAMPASAKAKVKSYKASKVTAKQIAKELKKTLPVTNVVVISKKNKEYTDIFNHPNLYKSKVNFYDKKYKKIYCTVEVFRNKYDAATRVAEIRALDYIYGTLDIAVDIPIQTFRYKNVVIRLNHDMPTSYAKKYYKALKKIVK